MSNLPSFFGKDFDRFFIGFDEHFKRINQMQEEIAKNIPSYPPYNVKKVDDNHYAIEMAVAGFGQQDIDIEMKDGKLIIRGNLQSEEDSAENFIFKGIANRAFTRTFALEDEIEVKDAEIFNGMLKIVLERLIPEHKQPKKIPVKAKTKKQLLVD